MEKLADYKNIVRQLLNETVALFPKNSHFEVMEIIDEEKGQYLIYTDGWEETARDYGCFFHIQVRPDAKIYLRHDGTDLELAKSLIEKGVDQKDIVLAFQAPEIRELTEFAVA